MKRFEMSTYEADSYRWLIAYAPPGWALFEIRTVDGEWRTNSWSSGQFNFGDDEAGRYQAMDEFVILGLRFPTARIIFEDQLGNERELAWLEYATHRLRREIHRGVVLTSIYPDDKLKRWKYWDRDERARDAIRLGVAAIREWKEEG